MEDTTEENEQLWSMLEELYDALGEIFEDDEDDEDESGH
jgi:hypothetical protein